MSVDLDGKSKVVGLKQSRKAIKDGLAECVYVASDAEHKVTAPILELCEEKGVRVLRDMSMDELGKACGIAVGAAIVAVTGGA